jgi:hypothetical protein
MNEIVALLLSIIIIIAWIWLTYREDDQQMDWSWSQRQRWGHWSRKQFLRSLFVNEGEVIRPEPLSVPPFGPHIVDV